jgi:hypothetical protein
MMAGAGLGLTLAAMEPGERYYMLGLIPFMVGLAILIYVYRLAPKLPAGE